MIYISDEMRKKIERVAERKMCHAPFESCQNCILGFFSTKRCPNCKHNNKRQADLYLLHGKGKCWTCGTDMKNFQQSEFSKRKLKELGVGVEE